MERFDDEEHLAQYIDDVLKQGKAGKADLGRVVGKVLVEVFFEEVVLEDGPENNTLEVVDENGLDNVDLNSVC